MSDTYTSRQVCRATGVTYRQLDYWLRRGHVRGADRRPGSGKPRALTFDAVAQVAFLAECHRAGLLTHRLPVAKLTRLARGQEVRLGNMSLRYDREGAVRRLTTRLQEVTGAQ